MADIQQNTENAPHKLGGTHQPILRSPPMTSAQITSQNAGTASPSVSRSGRPPSHQPPPPPRVLPNSQPSPNSPQMKSLTSSLPNGNPNSPTLKVAPMKSLPTSPTTNSAPMKSPPTSPPMNSPPIRSPPTSPPMNSPSIRSPPTSPPMNSSPTKPTSPLMKSSPSNSSPPAANSPTLKVPASNSPPGTNSPTLKSPPRVQPHPPFTQSQLAQGSPRQQPQPQVKHQPPQRPLPQIQKAPAISDSPQLSPPLRPQPSPLSHPPKPPPLQTQRPFTSATPPVTPIQQPVPSPLQSPTCSRSPSFQSASPSSSTPPSMPLTRINSPPTTQPPQPPRAQPPSQKPPGLLAQSQTAVPAQPPEQHSPPKDASQSQQSQARPQAVSAQPSNKHLAKTTATRNLASSAPGVIQSTPHLNLVHYQSAPNLPSRVPPKHPLPPRPPAKTNLITPNATPNGTGNVSDDPARRPLAVLVRSNSVNNVEPPRPPGTSPRKPPPVVSPRRLTANTPVARVPLIDRLTEKDMASVIRAQSYIRGWVLRRKFKKRVKDNIHRTKVARELLSSEETYVEGLNVINQTYLEQLAWNAKVSPNPFLTTDQIGTIFSTVAGITTFNRTLLEKLRERVGAWSPTQMIGDVFLTMAPFLKLYTTYCTNYDQAIQTLQKAKQATNFAAFLETCLKSTTHTLESLLITVVQRVPRYILLLQDIIKHTWPEHVDYANLTNTLKIVHVKLNKGIGEAEALSKVVALQSTIVGLETPLVAPSRVYVREGPIFECALEAKQGKDLEKSWFFLFNDAIIITDRKKDEKYQSRNFVAFTEEALKVKDISDTTVVQHAFQIVSPTISLFLSCQDQPTKIAILEQAKQFREQLMYRLNLAKGEQVEDPVADDNKMGSELTVSIPRTETCKDGKKEYTLYHTKIRDDKTKKGTIISKRYSEFDHLHKTLKKEFPDTEIMDLPKKHLVGSMSKETVESRRVMLEMYLQALVQKPEIRTSDIFHNFIAGYTAPPSQAKKSRKNTLTE